MAGAINNQQHDIAILLQTLWLERTQRHITVRRAAETEDQRRHQADDATALVIGLGHGTKLVDNVRKARTMPGNL